MPCNFMYIASADTSLPNCVLYVYSFTLFTERDRTTYPDLLYFLKDVSDWQSLGAHILPGNTEGPIEIIYTTHKGDVQECKKALFLEYLKAGDRSWTTVIAALIKIGNKNLAKEVKQNLGL